MIFSFLIPPFVESSSLLARIHALVYGIISRSSYGFSELSLVLSAVAIVLFLFGSLLGLIFFGIRYRPSWARVGMLLSLAGLILITIFLFDYSGDQLTRIFTIGNVGQWPSLGFFGTGFFLAWLGVVAGIFAAQVRSPQLTVAIQAPQPASAVRQIPAGLIPTGYNGLDNMMMGGLPLGASVIMTGPPCDEKRLIMKRFLETNLTNNRGCLYLCNSLDQVRDLIPRHRKLLQVILCHPQADTIASEFPDVVKLKTVENLTEINLAYTSSLSKFPSGRPSVLCMEILDDVLLDHHGATRRWLMDILGRSKSSQITCLATLNTAMHAPQEAQAVLETFDGHIDLFEGEVQVRPKLIRIRKLAGRKFLDEELLVRREKI